MGKYLFTADLHLTTQARDAYRWEIFPWLETQVSNRRIDGLFLLGDLTEQKDNHPSKLTNRLFDAIRLLSRMTQVVILKGNHDYVDPDVPFFKFLEKQKDITYFTKNGEIEVAGSTFLCLPHTKHVMRDWYKLPVDQYDFILIHQALRGARMANGYEVDGTGAPGKVFERTEATVIAGDIHVPQWVGNVVYCGSPHPVDFGDEWEPRVLLWDEGKLRSIKRLTLKKQVVELSDPDRLDGMFHDLTEGDQVKVTLKLRRADFGLWKELRQKVIQAADAKGLVLCGIKLEERRVERVRLSETPRSPRKSAVEVFDAFVKGQRIDPTLALIGREIIEPKTKEVK